MYEVLTKLKSAMQDLRGKVLTKYFKNLNSKEAKAALKSTMLYQFDVTQDFKGNFDAGNYWRKTQ